MGQLLSNNLIITAKMKIANPSVTTLIAGRLGWKQRVEYIITCLLFVLHIGFFKIIIF